MNNEYIWKNFKLGKELDISGRFICNGLKCLDTMEILYHEEEIFEMLYNFSVGFERLLKICVILIEYNGNQNDKEFEKSLITHDHLNLLKRIKKQYSDLPFANIHNNFLQMLSKFYKSTRYERYNINSVLHENQDREQFVSYIEKHYNINIDNNFPFVTFIDDNKKLKKSIGKMIGKISSSLCDIIRGESAKSQLYTYEIRYDTKAAKIFMHQEYDFEKEHILTKELLIFFMKIKNIENFNILNDLESLPFDPALSNNYLKSFNNDEKKLNIFGELETYYDDLKNAKDRLSIINILGNYHENDEDEEN